VKSKPRVAVLMSTYNGGRWIKEQLDSILIQSNVDVSLKLRDDGSNTENRIYLTRLEKSLDPELDLVIEFGENLGPARSFLTLLRNQDVQDYIALSDQDDVWFPKKLENAVERLKPFVDVPALYCSNVVFHSNDSLNGKKSSLPNPELPLSVFQNSAMGCTIVLNSKGHQVIKSLSGESALMHDWYILIAILLTGHVIFDEEPSMQYRLHSEQTIGWRRKRSLSTIFSLSLFQDLLNQCLALRNELEGSTSHKSSQLDEFLAIVALPRWRRASKIKSLRLRNNRMENIWTKIRLLIIKPI